MKLKILHLEDTPADAELVGRCLKNAKLDCEIKVVDTKIDFQNSLKYFSPDIILSDHTLPQFNSTEALTMVKVRGANASTPFILVTGTVSEEFAASCIKNGAVDYILKKNLMRLPSAIQQAMKQKETEEKLKKSENRLRTTLDSMMEGVQIIGYDFRYLYVNDAVAMQGKNSKESLIGHTMMEKYPGIENTTFFSVLRQCMAERCSQIMENDFSYPDGSKGWFELSIQPAPEGVIILSMDITKRKLAEDKLVQSEKQIRNFAAHLNKTVEDERTRIARELHDELGQHLAGIKISLSVLRSHHRELEDDMSQLMKNADEAIQSMRKVATALRPGILDTLGLIPSIRWLAAEFEKKSNIKCYVDADEQVKIALKDATSIFRICQEALTNILKHAEATEAVITVKNHKGKMILKIEDNGKGVQSEKLENPFSMGLIGMRERARIIEAELTISSEKNAGTSVVLTKEVEVLSE